MSRTFVRTSEIAASPHRVWQWHARPGALERLVPPWERVRVLRRTGGIGNGDRTELELAVGPGSVTWVAEHRDSEPDRGFTDVMLRGPFASWTHRHSFEASGDGCRLTDRIQYSLPAGAVGDALAGPSVESRLRRTFGYRHRVTARDLALHSRYPLGGPKRFLVSGSTGLVGSSLVALLFGGGHHVTRLSRGSAKGVDTLGADRVQWDPGAARLESRDVDGFDVVVHLAGESIAAGSWTPERKARIRDSRVNGTSLLADALARADRKPTVLVCASAIGFYGNREDEPVDESAAPGAGFLADTCQAWEEAAEPARRAGIRVVHLRIGMVLTPAGGALARMLPPARLGLGGPLGDGSQFWSWISLDDLLASVLHVAARDDLEGPVNAVTPMAPTNRDFATTLGRVLGRPARLPAPASVLRLAMGEMAEELLLGGARVVPARLLESGFDFGYPELEMALRHVTGRVTGDDE